MQEESRSTPLDQRTHLRHWFVGRLPEVLAESSAAPVSTLSDEALAETIAERLRGLARQQAALLEEVAEAERRDLATTLGSTGLTALLRSLAPLTAGEATRHHRLARALDRHDATREALVRGELLADQAAEIVAAVDALPRSVGPELRAQAEQHLLVEAGTHDAAALRRLGRHLHEVVDPDHADELLDARLRREEREAARRCHFSGVDDGKGSYFFRGRIPSLHGAMLTAALQAHLNPALPDAIAREVVEADPDEPDRLVTSRRETPELLGEALCRLVERYPASRLPTNGGVNATVVVTIPLEVLEGRLGAAGILGSPLRLSAGEARRLACAAGVIPAVLGGRSEVLDLGRRRRLHSRAQRVALALRQGGTCGIEGCDRPSTWCDSHHLVPWSQGGSTDVADGLLICPRHHTLAHSGRFDLHRQPDGRHRLRRRP